MKTIASLVLSIGSLLFAASATAADSCLDFTHAASKAAQDYRLTTNKVRSACNSSQTDCIQSKLSSDHALELVVAANQAMQTGCVFIDPVTDDSLPVTTSTVLSALGAIPDSMLIPCSTNQGFEIGCPNGWVLNTVKSNTTVAPVSANQFRYSIDISASASIPINYPQFGLSCTMQLTIASTQIGGPATFSSSTSGGPINRLQLSVENLSLGSVQASGCSVISGAVELLAPIMESSIFSTLQNAFTVTYCGAPGPELFGPCP